MLTWTQRDGVWYADEYRIELHAPGRWVLVDLQAIDNSEAPMVSTSFEPLAVEPTLRLCQREARLIATARQGSLLRRRYTRLFLLALGAAIFLVGQSVVLDVLIVAGLLAVAFRSLGVIVGSFSRHDLGQPHEVFFQ